MSVLTINLIGFFSGSSVSLEYVIPIGDKFQVKGITAEPIVTDMVENGNIPAFPVWYGLDKPSVYVSVNPISDLVDSNVSITRGGSTTSPYPTIAEWVNWVYDYFSEKARDCLRR